MLERWSSELDGIVWLVASDDTLLARIDRRDKPHEAKGTSTQAAQELIASHRQAYQELLETIDRAGRLRVLRYDTGAMQASEIADELAATFGETEPHRLTDARRDMNVR
jgi:deoxyadenosine/deoxycytidine kinase